MQESARHERCRKVKESRCARRPCAGTNAVDLSWSVVAVRAVRRLAAAAALSGVP